MEVSEARTEQDQARDSLIKARVTIHSFKADLVEQDIQAGPTLAKTQAEGKAALAERDRRRRGLRACPRDLSLLSCRDCAYTYREIQKAIRATGDGAALHG